MSNQIGELFKILGKNEIFANYVKEIENGKTNQEIVDFALNDEALMCSLTMVVSDMEIIKNKMDVIIGQKRKNYEKKIANETKEAETKEAEKSIVEDTKCLSEEDLVETKEEVIEFRHKPINPDNVIWLNNYIYMERVDHLMRLVTTEFEIFY